MSRILLIEDEVAIRRVLKKILLEEDASHSIHEAEDGKIGHRDLRRRELGFGVL
jgi:CheY-like chemotaxis protein